MKTFRHATGIAALVLTGCASAPVIDFPTDHPANPEAPAAVMPPAVVLATAPTRTPGPDTRQADDGKPRRSEQSGIEQDVKDRIGQRMAWHTGREEDPTVARTVAGLLQGPMTADTAVRVALLNDRRLQAHLESLGIARADLARAAALPNPILDAEVLFPEGGGGAALEVGVAFGLLEALYIPMRRSIAESALEAAKAEVTGQVVAIAAQARRDFLRYQAAEQLLELKRTVLLSAEAGYELAKRIHEAGNSTRLDLANHRAFFEETKLELAWAEASATELRERLIETLGLFGTETGFAIAGRLPELPGDEPDWSDLERRAVGASLDLSASHRWAEQAARRVALVRPLGWLSDLELGIKFERDSDGGHAAGPTLQLPIPLFSQGRPALDAAEARLRQALRRHYALAVQVRSETRSAWSRVVSARQRAEHYRDVILPLRQTIVEESQKQFNGMFIGAFELLQARRRQVESAGEYVQALRDYWLARTDLQQLLAGRSNLRLDVDHSSNNPTAREPGFGGH